MQLWKQKSSHDIFEAKNWTPDLLGALAISRTKGVENKVRNKVNNLFNRNKLNPNKLMMAFLEAKWKISFGHEEIIQFFYDRCHFKDKEEAISHAMVLLCMRIHIEHPGVRATDIDEVGQNKVKTVMRVRNNLGERQTQKKAA